MPLPRNNIRTKGIRTLADIEARCLPEGDCLRWQGTVTKDGMPTLWIPGVGPRGVQVGFHLATTGSAVLPGRLVYIPTCGNLWCCSFAHRRPGDRSELYVIINGRGSDARRASYEKRREHYAEIRAAKEARKPPKPVKVPKAPKPPKVPKVVKLKPAPKQAAAPKLHAIGRDVPGQVVGQAYRGAGPSIYRHTGSNARRVEPPVKPEPGEARITERTRVTIAPTCTDQRYTVRELPAGYRSALDPREARPWAQAAAGSRAG